MNKSIFSVTFQGQVLDGWAPDEVKSNMAQLFKLDINNAACAQILEKLFSGKQVTIKAGLQRSAAQSYIDAITNIGGNASIHPKDVPPAGISERRFSLRRKQGDRRATRRLSSILPDRRKTRGRRHGDPQPEL